MVGGLEIDVATSISFENTQQKVFFCASIKTVPSVGTGLV